MSGKYIIEMRRNSYAVKRLGSKRSAKIFQNQQEAEAYVINKNSGDLMIHHCVSYYDKSGRKIRDEHKFKRAFEKVLPICAN